MHPQIKVSHVIITWLCHLIKCIVQMHRSAIYLVIWHSMNFSKEEFFQCYSILSAGTCVHSKCEWIMRWLFWNFIPQPKDKVCPGSIPAWRPSSLGRLPSTSIPNSKGHPGLCDLRPLHSGHQWPMYWYDVDWHSLSPLGKNHVQRVSWRYCAAQDVLT